jgi:glycosyltransferase 2 family protein
MEAINLQDKKGKIMTKGRFKWFTLFRYLGILLFIIVISQTNLRELWGWLKTVDVWMILVALLLQGILLFIKSCRWFLLNEKAVDRNKVYQRFGEFMEAYALGAVTPGRMGELFKAGHARGRPGVISAGLLVVSERGFDLSIFFCVAGISLIFSNLPGLSPIVKYLLLLAGLAGISIAIAIQTVPVVMRWTGWLMKRLRIMSRDQSLEFRPRSSGSLWAFIILSILSNLTAFLSFYFTALAVHLGLGFIKISGSVAIAGVINTIPITIMGIGTRDITLLYLLKDVPQAQVIAFSGLILLVFQVFGGVLALVGGEFFLQLARRKR